MTIIAAVIKGRELVVASDSQTNWGSHREHGDNVRWPKVRRFGKNLIGSSGWALYDNILDDYLGSRKRMPPLSDERVIFRFFCDLWHDMKERYGFVNDQCDGRTDSPFVELDGAFLIANPHGLFGVSGNMSVVRYRRFHAIGGGSDYAFGALHVLYEGTREPETLARRAAETAIHFNIHCGGEVLVERIKLRS